MYWTDWYIHVFSKVGWLCYEASILVRNPLFETVFMSVSKYNPFCAWGKFENGKYFKCNRQSLINCLDPNLDIVLSTLIFTSPLDHPLNHVVSLFWSRSASRCTWTSCYGHVVIDCRWRSEMFCTKMFSPVFKWKTKYPLTFQKTERR